VPVMILNSVLALNMHCLLWHILIVELPAPVYLWDHDLSPVHLWDHDYYLMALMQHLHITVGHTLGYDVLTTVTIHLKTDLRFFRIICSTSAKLVFRILY